MYLDYTTGYLTVFQKRAFYNFNLKTWSKVAFLIVARRGVFTSCLYGVVESS